MPLYDFRCGTGHVFEQHVPITGGAAPPCPACGVDTTKLPSAGRLLGRASAGLSKDEMPQTWKGTYNGNPEYIAGLRNQWSARQKLESKYPEIAGDQRPVLAHEGRYHNAPLRAGDVEVGGSNAGHSHGHGHSHGGGHGHSHSASAPAQSSTAPPSGAKPATPGP